MNSNNKNKSIKLILLMFIFVLMCSSFAGATDLYNKYYTGNSLDYSAQETEAYAVFIGDSGTKAYVIGNQYEDILQYNLAIAYDVNSGVYYGALDTSSQDSIPQGLFISTDGTQVYTIGNNNNRVYQYTLTDPWNITSGAYASKSMDLSGQVSGAAGLFINSAGTTAYVGSIGTDDIFQYTLSTPDDISTGSYTSKSLDVSGQDGTVRDFSFNSGGTELFMLGQLTNKIYTYNCSTPGDIDTCSIQAQYLDVSGQETTPTSMHIDFGEDEIYLLGTAGDKILEYSSEESVLSTNMFEAYWNFDNNLLDSTDNGHNLTNNGATYTTSGKLNGAYSFDGINDYVSNTDIEINEHTFSISTWVYWEGRGGTVNEAIFYDNLTGSNYDDVCFLDNGDNLLKCYWAGSAGGYSKLNTAISGSTTIPKNQWTHITIIKDGDTMRSYIDGELAGTTVGWGTYTATTNDFDIGISTVGYEYKGVIDEYGILNNKVINQQEAWELYQ